MRGVLISAAALFASGCAMTSEPTDAAAEARVATLLTRACLPWVLEQAERGRLERDLRLGARERADLVASQPSRPYRRVGPGATSLELEENEGTRLPGWKGLRYCVVRTALPRSVVERLAEEAVARAERWRRDGEDRWCDDRRRVEVTVGAYPGSARPNAPTAFVAVAAYPVGTPVCGLAGASVTRP